MISVSLYQSPFFFLSLFLQGSNLDQAYPTINKRSNTHVGPVWK